MTYLLIMLSLSGFGDFTTKTNKCVFQFKTKIEALEFLNTPLPDRQCSSYKARLFEIKGDVKEIKLEQVPERFVEGK